MLFQAIDYLFGTNFQNHHIIQNVQNINCLVVSTFTSIGAIYYFTTSSYLLIPYTFKLIFAHCTVDLFLTNKFDLVIHHIITITLGSFFFYKPLSTEDVHFECIILSLAELSSIFLVGRDFIQKNSPFYQVNNYMFILSFFYTRLYLLPKYLLLSPDIHTFFMKIMTYTDIIWYYGSLYSFMAINIYWGTLMLKTICKQVRKRFPSQISYAANEFYLQYTYYTSFITALCVYGNNIEYQLLDISGILLLAYNSGEYHHILYKTLIENTNKDSEVVTINVLSPKIRPYYIADILSIQTRSFLYIASRIFSLYDDGLLLLGVLLGFHSIAMYNFYEYLFCMIENKMGSYYASNDTLIDHAIRLPILLNIIFAFMYSNTLVNAHCNLLSFMLIVCCLFVRPGYELNHTCLHLCLLYQTYALCIANE
jgi:hypothetical protein